jgi:hypothetical protein
VAVIIILCLAGYLLKGEWNTQEMLNWLLAYINPGSRDSQDAPFDRVYALVIGFFGMVFLTGAFVSVITNIIQLRKDDINNGINLNYRFKNHVIIIGYNKMTVSLIQQISSKYPNVEIVLQTVQKAPDIRHELYANLSPEIEKRVIIVAGNRISKGDLHKLRPEHCQEIFLLGETDEYDHDSLNIKSLELVGNILREKKPKVAEPCRCHVLFEYQSTYAVFQQQDILNIKDCIDFVPFNFYECWAQKVFVDGKMIIKENEKQCLYDETIW